MAWLVGALAAAEFGGSDVSDAAVAGAGRGNGTSGSTTCLVAEPDRRAIVARARPEMERALSDKLGPSWHPATGEFPAPFYITTPTSCGVLWQQVSPSVAGGVGSTNDGHQWTIELSNPSDVLHQAM
eukprot:COSAG02_NODE_34100_length_489_cov_1.315385_1_plen_126_part_01